MSTDPVRDASPSPGRTETPGTWEYALLGIAVALRLAWPFGSSPTHVDEGGWPLAVRTWAVDGLVTFDFHKAPLYHLVLGTYYKLAPPTMMAGRLFSVALSLASLWLLWWVARRLLDDRRGALWAALLWACCFPANDVMGRALIEPLQVLFLLGLFAAMCLEDRRAMLLTALAAACVILTKANAVVVFPGLAAALWMDRSGPWRARRNEKLMGLGLGLGVAALGFLALYLYDAETFRYGWGTTVARPDVVTAPGALRLGRFVLDPRTVEHGLEFLSGQTPFVLVLGVLGALRALSLRSATAPAFALLLMLPFVLLNADQPIQYFATLYPAFALTGAALLIAAYRAQPARFAWPVLAIALVSAEGLARSAAAPVLLSAPERPAVAWLREHVGADERVIAAPYILMQLRQRGISMFDVTTFEAPLSPAKLAETRATWIAVDVMEWDDYARLEGREPANVDAGFAACCEQAYADGFIRVFRVRSAAASTP